MSFVIVWKVSPEVDWCGSCGTPRCPGWCGRLSSRSAPCSPSACTPGPFSGPGSNNRGKWVRQARWVVAARCFRFSRISPKRWPFAHCLKLLVGPSPCPWPNSGKGDVLDLSWNSHLNHLFLFTNNSPKDFNSCGSRRNDLSKVPGLGGVSSQNKLNCAKEETYMRWTPEMSARATLTPVFASCTFEFNRNQQISCSPQSEHWLCLCLDQPQYTRLLVSLRSWTSAEWWLEYDNWQCIIQIIAILKDLFDIPLLFCDSNHFFGQTLSRSVMIAIAGAMPELVASRSSKRRRSLSQD